MAALICTAILCVHTPLKHSTYVQQMSTCLSLVAESQSAGIAPALVTSLAWHEARLLPDRTSSKGAKGPLQVIPKFWCESEPCDYIKAGLKALKHYLGKEADERRAICRYNAGRCIPSAWDWSGKVMRLTEKVREITRVLPKRRLQLLTQSLPLPTTGCCPTMDALYGLLLW